MSWEKLQRLPNNFSRNKMQKFRIGINISKKTALCHEHGRKFEKFFNSVLELSLLEATLIIPEIAKSWLNNEANFNSPSRLIIKKKVINVRCLVAKNIDIVASIDERNLHEIVGSSAVFLPLQ